MSPGRVIEILGNDLAVSQVNLRQLLSGSLPDVSLAFCFFSALLSQLAHHAAYLRLYP